VHFHSPKKLARFGYHIFKHPPPTTLNDPLMTDFDGHFLLEPLPILCSPLSLSL